MLNKEPLDETGMYLRRIAKTPLLNPQCELLLAERICHTRVALLTRIMANDLRLRVVLAQARKAARTNSASITLSTYKGSTWPRDKRRSSVLEAGIVAATDPPQEPEGYADRG